MGADLPLACCHLHGNVLAKLRVLLAQFMANRPLRAPACVYLRYIVVNYCGSFTDAAADVLNLKS